MEMHYIEYVLIQSGSVIMLTDDCLISIYVKIDIPIFNLNLYSEYWFKPLIDLEQAIQQWL